MENKNNPRKLRKRKQELAFSDLPTAIGHG
jgi:hypothetical protein